MKSAMRKHEVNLPVVMNKIYNIESVFKKLSIGMTLRQTSGAVT